MQQTNSHASMLARMRPEILNQTFSRLLHGDAFDPMETQALLSDLGFQYQFNDRIVVLLLRLPEQRLLFYEQAVTNRLADLEGFREYYAELRDAVEHPLAG